MIKGSLNIVSGVICVSTLAVAALLGMLSDGELAIIVPILVIGTAISLSPRQINEWERAVLLRVGRFHRVCKPGITWIVPGADAVTALVDMRIRSTPFTAEKTLTRDTVPVDVDAVLFWFVTDAQKAVLEVRQFESTVSWAAQTTLRDVIGQNELVRMIGDRRTIDEELQAIIDTKTSEWGITVQSVEIRDVKIPSSLEDAMSRKAQADREKAARVILAESEVLVANEIERAAKVYEQNPTALRLRAMNMTYEAIKEKGALMVIPSGMTESINPGVVGMASLGFRAPETTA